MPVSGRPNIKAAGRLLVLIASCLAALCLTAGEDSDVQAQAPPERPNIVFLLTDDMDPELLDYMPIVKGRLVNQGVKFDNAFVTLPVCCPSRASSLRGQYAHNHDVETNTFPEGGEPKFRELGRDQSTVATWLESSGYKTALVGKYLNHYNDEYVPPGWSEWYATIGNGEGSDGSTLNENGTIRNYDQYPTDLYRDRALDFIDGAKDPFFLWVGFHAPHSPAVPAPRHAGLYSDLQLPQPPSFNEGNVSDKPRWVKSLPRLSGSEINRLRTLQRNRVRSLQAVDEAVGAIVDRLRQQGELDNTYIVFTSDNGLSMGEHRWTRKYAAYEESVGVPLLVRGPGVEKRVVRNHIVTNNDLAPTFAALGRANAPDFVDGKSFDGLLRPNPPASSAWRRATLLERLHQPAAKQGSPARPDQNMPPFVALRTENQVYVKYSTGEKELYNLSKDPYQLTSRHASMSPTVSARFDAWLEALRDCTAQYCTSAERRPDTKAPDTSITEMPANPSNGGSASFGFEGADSTTLPEDLSFQCRLDSSEETDFEECPNPKSYADLAPGPHTFEVRAVDEAGNRDPTPARYLWTIQAGGTPP